MRTKPPTIPSPLPFLFSLLRLCQSQEQQFLLHSANRRPIAIFFSISTRHCICKYTALLFPLPDSFPAQLFSSFSFHQELIELLPLLFDSGTAMDDGRHHENGRHKLDYFRGSPSPMLFRKSNELETMYAVAYGAPSSCKGTERLGHE
ncbi:hypothetical protein SDJN02_26645, partial [Cucurbita argyrosperma subsp. argyrosperma]